MVRPRSLVILPLAAIIAFAAAFGLGSAMDGPSASANRVPASTPAPEPVRATLIDTPRSKPSPALGAADPIPALRRAKKARRAKRTSSSSTRRSQVKAAPTPEAESAAPEVDSSPAPQQSAPPPQPQYTPPAPRYTPPAPRPAPVRQRSAPKSRSFDDSGPAATFDSSG